MRGIKRKGEYLDFCGTIGEGVKEVCDVIYWNSEMATGWSWVFLPSAYSLSGSFCDSGGI